MTDLHARFKTLDDMPTPNLWHEIEKRAMAIQPTSPRIPWLLVIAALLLALAIGGAALVASGVVTLPKPSLPPFPSSSSWDRSPPPVVHRAASWAAAGNMIDARRHLTATLLPDDKVLVAGGVGGEGFGGCCEILASAELYDPSSRTWTATGNMVTGHVGATATLLPDGSVLVTGGNGGSAGEAQASAELYDPSDGTWAATGSMGSARAEHKATLLPDGRVLVTGGYDARGRALDSAEMYDPSRGIWTAAGNMIVARRHHTATLLSDGRVLVTGGYDARGRALDSAELYDPSSGRWTATGSMGGARAYYTATLLSDGRVLVTGGYDARGRALDSAELYDPSSGRWTATGSMGGARGEHTATLLSDGRVLVIGGSTSITASGSFGPLASAELYDPSRDIWSATKAAPTSHGSQTATLLPDGTVLVVGGGIPDGTGGARSVASAELYDLGSGNYGN